ncbi:hypothetical protein ACT4UT_10195, partial [Bacillus sp. B-TM1]
EMISQLSWKVGGQQGEGIESTGEIFSYTPFGCIHCSVFFYSNSLAFFMQINYNGRKLCLF